MDGARQSRDAADGARRRHFLEALRINPDVPETQMNAGRLLVGEGALDEGIEHLRAALRLNPEALRLDARLEPARRNLIEAQRQAPPQ